MSSVSQSTQPNHPSAQAEQVFHQLQSLTDNECEKMWKLWREFHPRCKCVRDTTQCGFTARVIMYHNPFRYRCIKHCYGVDLKIMGYLTRLIEKPKARIYNLWLGACHFVDPSDKEKEGPLFVGHALAVIQYDDGDAHFKVVQSYVERWTMREDLEKKAQLYHNKEQLTQQVIDPFIRLALHNGPWTARQVKDFNTLSGVEPKELLGMQSPEPLGIGLNYLSKTPLENQRPRKRQKK